MRTALDGVVAPFRRAPVRLAAVALLLAGCQPGPASGARTSPAPSAGREIVITEADIAHMGARNAWDAVRTRVPKLAFSQDSSGRPGMVRIQESRTINGSQSLLLVVDGAQVGDLNFLSDIPASDVHLIRVLEGEAAQQLYGLAAFNGAIVVETKHGR